ncbi:hypothetical protein HMPREF1602_00562, partial [Escherichia coli 907889]
IKHSPGNPGRFNLAEHADTHGRNLTALGHILCVKTHDETPGKSGTGQKRMMWG